VFIDTAGLREARDQIEAEGVRRSRRSFENAEFILHVFDSSQALTSEDDHYLSEFAGKKRVIVRNKMDLPERLRLPLKAGERVVDVCCLSGAGIEGLKDMIKDLVWSGGVDAGLLEVMINSRHQEALARARTASLRSLEALSAGESLEVVAMDLRIAVDAVGEIVGKTATEDLLDLIFSQFCIGK